MLTRRLLVAPVLLFAVLPAQSLLWTQTGTPGIGIGDFSALLGDRDGDGFDDFITLAAVRTSSRVEIQMLPVSGRDGSFLPGGAGPPLPDHYLGNLARAGDMDGDGVSEYAAMVVTYATSMVTLEVRSGRDDGLIWAVADRFLGQEICGDLDLNGDGHPDLLVGSSNFSVRIPANGPFVAVGCIWAFDYTGRPLYQRIGTDPAFVIGGPLARLGDVDGDGCDDYLMAVGGDPVLRPGYVDIVSGRSGQTIRRVQGAQPGDAIGEAGLSQSLSACGDLDGDGLPDFIAGGGAYAAHGTVQAFSSATGQLLHAWYSGHSSDLFGAYIVGDIDVDRDGVTDIIASEPIGGVGFRGLVHVYSGRDWSEIFQFTETDPISGAGFTQILRMPPQSGEVFPRFMVAGPAYLMPGIGFIGRHYMFSGAPQGVVPSGQGCLGTLGTRPIIGLRDLGAQGARVTLSGAQALGGAIIIAGLSIAQPPFIDLGALGFTGCTLHPMPLEWAFKLVDATGYAFHDFHRPLGPFGSGITAYGQWVALGSGASFPGAASDSLRWSVR